MTGAALLPLVLRWVIVAAVVVFVVFLGVVRGIVQDAADWPDETPTAGFEPRGEEVGPM